MSMEAVCLFVQDIPVWAYTRVTGFQGAVVAHTRNRVVSLSSTLYNRDIHIGDTLDRARALATDALFIPADQRMEISAWEDLIRSIYSRVTPNILPTRKNGNPHAWIFIENPVPNALTTLTAEQNLRAGMAADRSLAMLAALKTSPGNITRIPFHTQGRFLRETPVTMLTLLNYDTDMIERLVWFGYHTLHPLLRLKKRHLDAQFGPAGQSLYDFLHPPPAAPIPPYVFHLIEEEYIFDEPVTEPAHTLPVLTLLLERLTRRLDNRLAGRVEIRLATGNGEKQDARIFREPVGNPEAITTTATLLLHSLFNQAMDVFTMTVILGALQDTRPEQQKLFFQRADVTRLLTMTGRRFPGQLLHPVIIHDTPFFPEEEIQLLPVDTENRKP
jgi:hypothetical protein